jgi:hypothetical protein
VKGALVIVHVGHLFGLSPDREPGLPFISLRSLTRLLQSLQPGEPQTVWIDGCELHEMGIGTGRLSVFDLEILADLNHKLRFPLSRLSISHEPTSQMGSLGEALSEAGVTSESVARTCM